MAARERLNILTFNTHEAYSYELAKTGHQFDVLLPKTRVLWETDWDEQMRPRSTARFRGPDVMESIGEMSHDNGVTWQPDFTMTYQRVE